METGFEQHTGSEGSFGGHPSAQRTWVPEFSCQREPRLHADALQRTCRRWSSPFVFEGSTALLRLAVCIWNSLGFQIEIDLSLIGGLCQENFSLLMHALQPTPEIQKKSDPLSSSRSLSLLRPLSPPLSLFAINENRFLIF